MGNILQERPDIDRPRWGMVDSRIRDLAKINPVIYIMLKQYLEDRHMVLRVALTQMVVELAAHNEALTKIVLDLKMAALPAPVPDSRQPIAGSEDG